MTPSPPTNPAPVGASPPADGVIALAVVLRVQRRLAVRTMALLLGGLILVPLLLAVNPAFTSVRVVGIPLLWLLLGAAAYPVLLLLAVRHRRAVDRVEGALAQRGASARSEADGRRSRSPQPREPD